MIDKNQIIKDVINDLHLLNQPKLWREHDNRDEVIRQLRFMSSSLKNAHTPHLLLLKALDAFLVGNVELAYNVVYSNKKMGTVEEGQLDRKFKNNETNFLGQLFMYSKSLEKTDNG
jgi:hypothetical protein